jgi:hypothetical protein
MSDPAPLRWRLRLAVANQLPHCCRIFGPQGTREVITELVINACEDDVSEVRHAGMKAIPALLLRLYTHDSEWGAQAIQRVLSWATHDLFDTRQRFIHVCYYIYGGVDEDEDRASETPNGELGVSEDQTRGDCVEKLRRLVQLDEMLLPVLVNLGQSDPVANVRMTFATLVRQCEYLSSLPACQCALTVLRDDRDRDVAIAAGESELAWWVNHGGEIIEARQRGATELKKLRDSLLNGPGYVAPPTAPPQSVADMV